MSHNPAETINHHLTHWSWGQGFWEVHLDSVLVSIVLALTLMSVSLWTLRSATVGVPGFWQNLLEALIEWIDDQVKEILGQYDEWACALAFTVFAWLLCLNTTNLLPLDLLPSVMQYFNIHAFRSVPTADFNVNFAIALGVFIVVQSYGISSKGWLNYISEFFHYPMGYFLFPINLLLRIVEEVIRPVSLAIRLFGNMYVGEIMTILITLLPWWAQWVPGSVWALFHILVNGLQAFIFMTLTIIYVGLAKAPHD